MLKAKTTMRRIGLDLINKKRRDIGIETVGTSKKDTGSEALHGRDLLSVLSKIFHLRKKPFSSIRSPFQHIHHIISTNVYRRSPLPNIHILSCWSRNDMFSSYMVSICVGEGPACAIKFKGCFARDSGSSGKWGTRFSRTGSRNYNKPHPKMHIPRLGRSGMFASTCARDQHNEGVHAWLWRNTSSQSYQSSPWWQRANPSITRGGHGLQCQPSWP